MVYISKVYTRFGDKGDTMLANGDTVPKDSARVRSYGDVDELQAFLGLARAAAGLGGQRLVALEGAGVEQHRAAVLLVRHAVSLVGARTR